MLSGSSRGAEEAATSPVREVQDQHQEHVGRGLGLGKGRERQTSRRDCLKYGGHWPAGSCTPSRAWERPPGSDQQTTATSQESGLTKDLLRPGQVFSQP